MSPSDSDISLTVTSDVFRHSAALDVASLDNPHLQDTIDRAQQNTAGGLCHACHGPLDGLRRTVQVVFTMAILICVAATDNIAYGDWQRMLDRPDRT